MPKVIEDNSSAKRSFPLIRLLVGLWISYSVIGCTHDHKIDLKPEVFVRVSNIGQGIRLVIQVRDLRSQKAISKKESNLKVTSGTSINTVNIYASSSVSDAVSDKVMEGFQRLGFNPSQHGNSSDPMITVEILKLKMNYQRRSSGINLPEIHAQMETILQIQASHKNQTLRKNYQTRMTKSHRMLTGKFKNERLINNSLSMAIQKMFDDPEFIRFLLPAGS